MKLTFDYTIPYQDVDMNRRLKLFTLENYLLETAAEAADQLGFGISTLMPYHYTWIIAHVQIEMTYLPTHKEQITIETWIESNAHSLSVRDFRIWLNKKDGEQRLIGRASTVWAVLDMQKREIVNIFSMPIFEGSVDGEVMEMPHYPRIRAIAEPTGTATHTIAYSDMDHNGHCNSCKYLEMMLNTKMPLFIREQHSKGQSAAVYVEINYSKEVMLGEEVSISYLENPTETCYHIKCDNDTTSCTCRINKLENV